MTRLDNSSRADPLDIGCPHCAETDGDIVDSRSKGKLVWRRRQCVNGHRWTTYEVNVNGKNALEKMHASQHLRGAFICE